MPQLTISFTAAHAQRMQSALEESLKLTDENGDPRPATMDDLKSFVKKAVVEMVRKSERRTAAMQAASNVTNVDLT